MAEIIIVFLFLLVVLTNIVLLIVGEVSLYRDNKEMNKMGINIERFRTK